MSEHPAATACNRYKLIKESNLAATGRGSPICSVSASYASGPDIDPRIRQFFCVNCFPLSLIQEEEVVGTKYMYW